MNKEEALRAVQQSSTQVVINHLTENLANVIAERDALKEQLDKLNKLTAKSPPRKPAP